MHGALAITVLAALLAQPPPVLERFEAVEPHMGTLVRITVYTPDEHSAIDAFRAAFARIGELDAILSDYRDESELNRVTRDAVGRPVRVSADLFTVLAASQDLARATDGAFDVTQGPVVRLWREARLAGRLPNDAALQEAAGRTGYRKLALDAAGRTVTLAEAGMALDVGGIAKGYAASEAVAVLRARGVPRVLVAVSGDLAFGDAPPGRDGWRVRIDADVGGGPAVVELTNAAVSTSGSAAQHLDIDGLRYSHIIDPSTRAGLVHDVSVTVIAQHGIEADGLATAVGILGSARGLQLVESRRGAAALIVDRTGPAVILRSSSRFPQFSSTASR